MGKKYIIELLDNCQSEFKGIIVFGLTPSNQISAEPIPVEDLTPYTEPDLEQVRKEAYDKGYTDAAYNCHERCAFLDDAKSEAYRKGLSDAWEAARKVTQVRKYGGYGDCLGDVFGRTDTSWDVFDYSASEAIEKIRQYEQRQEEQITKGDIVRIKSTPEVEILVTYADEEYASGIALTEVDGNCEIGDQYTNIRMCNVEKTGGHYDIVSVLQKMKES